MPVMSAELKLFQSEQISAVGTNGGRMSAVEIVSGVANNLADDFTEEERADGAEKWWKVFPKAHKAGRVPLTNAKVWLYKKTPGDSIAYFIAADQRNTQADITGDEPIFATGALVADKAATALEIQADFEPGLGAKEPIRPGGTIWIGYESGGTLTGEFRIVDTVSWSTDRATITLTQGLRRSYSAAVTFVASCLVTATVVATVDNYVKAGGFTFDDSGHPILGDGQGTIEQTWTLEFSSASAFTVTGDTVGSVGSGTTGSDFAPNNPTYSRPYFTIPSAAWGGSAANHNTLVFQTHPPTAPAFLKAELPADAASGDDGIYLAFTGGS